MSSNQDSIPIRGKAEVAWSEFINEYHALLMSIALGMVKNKQVAQDVVQESLERVCARIRQGNLEFQSKEHARNYIVQVVRNRAKDVVKAQSKKVPFEKIPAPAVSGPEKTFLDSQYEKDRIRQLETLRKAMRKLPRKYRDVLKLRFYERLKLREISKRLKIPLTTVQYREKTALEKLKKILEKSID